MEKISDSPQAHISKFRVVFIIISILAGLAFFGTIGDRIISLFSLEIVPGTISNKSAVYIIFGYWISWLSLAFILSRVLLKPSLSEASEIEKADFGRHSQISLGIASFFVIGSQVVKRWIEIPGLAQTIFVFTLLMASGYMLWVFFYYAGNKRIPLSDAWFRAIMKMKRVSNYEENE